MKIYVLIATVFDKFDNISLDNFPICKNVKYIISCQCSDNDEFDKVKNNNIYRHDFLVYPTISKGLSVNRNHLLEVLSDEDSIAIIADDDVKYKPSYFEVIRKCYKDNDDLDFITFKIETPEYEHREYKEYKKNNFSHSKRSLMNVSSIEITFRTSSVKNTNVHFDEKFGLGSGNIPKYEESIFLIDLLNQGLKGAFSNNYIVIHPFESSGKSLGYKSIQELEHKFVYLHRVFGYINGTIISILILMKNIYVLKFGFFKIGKKLFSFNKG